MSRRRAGILTIGNEVLYGQILDGNAAFLGRELQALGYRICWRQTVGDRSRDIKEAVRSGLARCDLVLCSGGLGPTSDDLTRPAVAGLFGAKLRLNPDILARIRQRFAGRGLEMPRCNRRQAMVPEGAIPLENPQGTAPGLLFQRASRIVVLLPGVPRELEAIWQESLRPMLVGKSGAWTAVETLRTFGLAESALAERLKPLEEELPAGSLAYLPSYRGVDLRLTCHGRSQALARTGCRKAARKIHRILGDRVYAMGQDTMEQVVGRLLASKRWNIFIAESCTGGLIADRLTDVPGSSDYLIGGVVAYSNRLKAKLLGVRPATIKRYGAVSRQTALEMARGGRRRYGCDLCLAATGIAGPGGSVPDKPVGLVFLAVSGHYGDIVFERRFLGSRRIVKEWAAQSGLDLVRRYLARRGRMVDR